MSKAGKEHTDDPVEKHPGQVVDPKGGSPEPEGQYHGLSPDQVKKIEDARGDDTNKSPLVEDAPPPEKDDAA